MRVAVLLATFNRREKTISCLKNLYDQFSPPGIYLTVFLTDDASTDGTPDAIKNEFPKVNLLAGSGTLFWAGGMRNSWREALKGNYNFYLLLNDDTLLTHGALNKLFSYAVNQSLSPSIYIGSTADSTGKISYGGHKLYSKTKVQSFNLYSEKETLECDLGNANVMLVPREIVNEIGVLSDSYTHSIADFDYTLRAKKAGFKVFVLPGIMGYCIDDHGNNWKSSKMSLSNRIKYLKSPKGLAYNEYLYFIKQHFPQHLLVAFTKLWLKTLFPVIWDKLKTHEA
jgi:GT2 family glycosyltransferase